MGKKRTRTDLENQLTFRVLYNITAPWRSIPLSGPASLMGSRSDI